jgi:hypothetical protein
VVITVAILSTAIIFIFRVFTTVLSSEELCQDILHASLLAEARLWEIEQGWQDLSSSGQETIQGKEFNWNYLTTDLPDSTDLKKLEFSLSWQENNKREEKLAIDTYLMPTK